MRLLYLAGLRAGELLRLTQADVDLDAGLLHIRHSKFDKSRVLPIAPDLVQHLVHCRTLATEHFGSGLPQKPFFSVRAEAGIRLPPCVMLSTRH